MEAGAAPRSVRNVARWREAAVTQTAESGRTETERRVSTWLTEFADALSAGDGDRTAALFADESYWRDLVSFTWNLVTVEGPAGAADLARSDAAQRAGDRAGRAARLGNSGELGGARGELPG